MRKRRMANRYHAPQLSKCPQCGSRLIPHRVCKECGYYKGRQVVSVESA
jgi:large subunit ribosomal protein L32